MKLRYLFSTILASVLLFTGCVEESIDSFENIRLSQTYLSIPVEGGSVSVTVTAQDDWAFVKGEQWPEWLTVDMESGKGGVETLVTFSAEATDSGRESELEIKAGGNSQFLRVRQGSLLAEMATCAEVIAGPDGKSYQVKGICTSIASDYYGNWYLKDDTGEIYIYGTVNADGNYDWASFDIAVGDSVYVEGPKTTYKETVELVNVSVIKVVKSLVSVASEPKMAANEGEAFDVKVAYKGKGIFYTIPDEYKEWVSVAGMEYKAGVASKLVPDPADTAIVTISVLSNPGASRKGAVEFSSSKGSAASVVTYEFSQAGIASIEEARKSASGDPVMIAGIVMAVHAKGYIVSDETASLYVYTNATPEVSVGNNVVVGGTFDNYYGTLQIKNPTVTSNDNATEAPEYPTVVNLMRQTDFDAFPVYSKDAPSDYPYVKIRGVLSAEDGRTITVGDSEKTASLDWSNNTYDELKGKTVIVTAYIKGYHSKGYYQLIETSVAEDQSGELPELTITPIEDVVADTEASYTVEGIVVAAGSQAYVIADATGNLLVYGKNHGRNVMEKVRLSGTASHYSGYNTNTLQLTATSVDVLLNKATWTYNPTVLDGAALDALIGKPSSATEVQFIGTVVKSGSYLNINVEGASAQATFKYVDTALFEKYADKAVVIKGYVMGTHQRLSVLPYSVSEVESE